jgi:SpoVK/Ycf46/Vps4 family AAA+-type ATPase
MPALRKSKKEKALNRTLRQDREAARTKPSNPKTELEDAREALEAMKQNMRQATQQIAEQGLMVTTQIVNSHGKFTEVQRLNPAVKVQREAMRAIKFLKRQIAELEEELKLLPVTEGQESVLTRILKSKEERKHAAA